MTVQCYSLLQFVLEQQGRWSGELLDDWNMTVPLPTGPPQDQPMQTSPATALKAANATTATITTLMALATDAAKAKLCEHVLQMQPMQTKLTNAKQRNQCKLMRPRQTHATNTNQRNKCKPTQPMRTNATNAKHTTHVL